MRSLFALCASLLCFVGQSSFAAENTHQIEQRLRKDMAKHGAQFGSKFARFFDQHRSFTLHGKTTYKNGPLGKRTIRSVDGVSRRNSNASTNLSVIKSKRMLAATLHTSETKKRADQNNVYWEDHSLQINAAELVHNGQRYLISSTRKRITKTGTYSDKISNTIMRRDGQQLTKVDGRTKEARQIKEREDLQWFFFPRTLLGER